MSYRTRGLAVVAGACLMVLAGAAFAQTTVTGTETKSFEVLAVDGNNVVVRGAEGTKELTLTDDFTLNVGGKQIGVHDLKPGMKGTATITTKTTSTPVTVTEVKNGEVLKVSGSSVIVRTEQGFRSFNQGDMTRRNVTVFRGGKAVDLSELHVGDHLSATIVTEGPPQVLTERQVQASITPDSSAKGSSATSSTAAKSSTASTSGEATTAAASGGGASSAALPNTASSLPLLVLVGMASLATASALAWRRRRG